MSAPVSTKLVNKPSFIEALGVRFLIMDAPTDSVLPTYIEVLRKKHVHTVCRACEATYTTSLLEQQGIRVIDLHFPDGDAPPNDVITQWLAIVKRTFPDSGPNHHSAAATASAHEDGGSRSPRAADAAPSSDPAADAAGADAGAGVEGGASDVSHAPGGSLASSGVSGVGSAGRASNVSTVAGGSSVGSGRDRERDRSSKATLAVHCVAGLGRAPVLVAIALIEAGMSAHDAIQLVRAKRRGALNSKQLRFLTKVYKPRRKQAGGSCCVVM